MMDEIFDKLRFLQKILSKKCEIEFDVNEIPKIISTKTELLNRLKKSYIEKNKNQDEITTLIKELMQMMNAAERERENYEQQMDLIKTQREYEALDKQIKDISAKEQEFRKQIQNQELQKEEMKNTLERESQMIQKQEEEIKTEQSRIKHELKEKQKLLKTLEKEESKITPGLDEEILFKFERIIKNKAGIGIVPIKNGICTGCHLILTPQFVNDVRMGNGIQFCPECSRIIFFQEENRDEETNNPFIITEDV